MLYRHTGWLLVCVALLAGPAAAAPLDDAPSGLVITEVMYNPPAEVEFPLGQWFEVYNLTDEPLSLAGLVVEVEGGDGALQSYLVEAPSAPVVEPHDFLVVGANKALAINGGVPVDYAYGAMLVLPKKGGWLRLYYGEILLDAVGYGAEVELAVPQGTSLSLEPDGMTASDNDDPAYWCASTQAVADSPVGTTGTPGAVGKACDSDGDGFDETQGDCADFDAKVSPGAAEKCNGIDDDCDGEVDEGPLADEPPYNKVGVCAQALPVCAGEEGWQWPAPEGWEEMEITCDYLDNDCDGETDEGLRNECGGCGADEQDVCDGIDNDCDGKTDEDAVPPKEGVECAGGKVGLCKETQLVCKGEEGFVCVPPAGFEEDETLCDGADNDCDGETDEGYPVGQACSVGEGMCRNQGIYACSVDRMSVECLAEPMDKLVEQCGDNVDNDCDGETDEGYPVGEACDAGVGACKVTGKYFCTADRLDVECSAVPLEPQPELCGNYTDDDCDGEVDEADCSDIGILPGGCDTAPRSDSGLTIFLLLAISVLVPGLRRRVGTPNA